MDLNDALASLAERAFGGKARLAIVDPTTLAYPKKNARFLERATFEQLTANIRNDGMLSSVPLCHERVDSTLEIISGTHRVKAAVRAGIPEVLVIVLPTQEESRRIAAQLSHNAIAGQDDPGLLRELWQQIKCIEDRLYSGLDSDMLGQLERIDFLGTGADGPKPKQIVLWFLDSEVQAFEALLDRVMELPSTAEIIYLAPRAEYEKLHRMLVDVKKGEKIRNSATAMLVLIRRLEAALEEDAKRQDDAKEKTRATD